MGECRTQRRLACRIVVCSNSLAQESWKEAWRSFPKSRPLFRLSCGRLLEESMIRHAKSSLHPTDSMCKAFGTIYDTTRQPPLHPTDSMCKAFGTVYDTTRQPSLHPTDSMCKAFGTIYDTTRQPSLHPADNIMLTGWLNW